MSDNIKKVAAGAVAVVAIGVGAAAIGSASSGSESRTANLAAGPGAGQAPPGTDQQAGGAPRDGLPAMGTAVTGTTADKVAAAALAKYPGTVERVVKLPDGTYVAHVIKKDGSGEVHVLVDNDFAVKGLKARPSGPPPGSGATPPGGPGGGQTPPNGSGTTPPSTGGAQTETN